jgi:hypothetical protein
MFFSGRKTVNRFFIISLLFVLSLVCIPNKGAAEESKLKFSGDLRGRVDGIWYDADDSGSRKEDRRRIRYRLRLNAKATINDHAGVAILFGSGDLDSRSGNQTLGSPAHFGSNELDIRRAYLIVNPFAGGKLPNRDGKWVFHFGRVPVPFVWKNGKDMMLFDNDINPAGLSTRFNAAMSDAAEFFANLGYFVIDENKSGDDPYLTGFQGGFNIKMSEKAKAGVRGSFYYMTNLDDDFIMTGMDGTGGSTSGAGNIAEVLTGDPDGGDLQVVATQGYVKLQDFPVTVFGGFSTNLSAEVPDSLDVTEEKVAYNFGIEGGDKKKNVRLGVGYYHIEANAFPSQFIDSDLFDGRTNRKGIMAYGSRQLRKGMDFNIKVFSSDVIENDMPIYEESVKGSKRVRLQVDLVHKF